MLDGACSAATIRTALAEKLGHTLVRYHLIEGLAQKLPEQGWKLEELLDTAQAPSKSTQPLITVAVCTRDRPEDLALCLDALMKLDYPHLDRIVIDNAPATNATEELVRERFPQIR